MGGMMGGTGQGSGGGRLCCGGAPPPSPLYPSLIRLPELTLESRQALERQAAERMAGGNAMMSDALGRLAAARHIDDVAGMQEANADIREGLSQFQSGVALKRALAEGSSPRDIALDWFRREMNLTPLPTAPPPHGFFGLSWFHYIVMSLLTAFTVGTLGMYFRRMRRAETLVARLAGIPTDSPLGLETRSAMLSEPRETPSIGTSAGSDRSPGPADIAPSKPNSWTGLLRVARIFDETPTVKTFRLSDPAGSMIPFSYLPGQFLTVTIVADGQPIKRSYTIASSPTQRSHCEITVKREEQGVVSRFLHDRVAVGDTLQITAPSGKFTFTGAEADSVVLIAGGVGVTPMMSVARHLIERAWPGSIYFVYAVRAEADVIFREELDYLRKRNPNLRVVLVAEVAETSAWPHARGRITRELLESNVPDLTKRRIHLCGPPAMMSAVKGILTAANVPVDQIHTEVFQGKEPPRAKLETLPATQASVAVVTFAKSRRTAMMPPTRTVLEASEDVGVDIEYSCRVGTCGVCRVKLLSGAVTMEVEDGLEPGDKERNVILACQAKSTADLTVDA
jgi:ferredoxin-NADP reductase